MRYYEEADFTPCRSAGYLMKRLHKSAHGLIEDRFSDIDVSFSQWVALAMLREGVMDTSAELASYLGHNSGATTRLVDSLEARGFIQRERDGEDRRIVRLSLTPEGAAASVALSPRVMDFWNQIFADFDRADVDQFVTMLQRISDKMEALSSDGGAGA